MGNWGSARRRVAIVLTAVLAIGPLAAEASSGGGGDADAPITLPPSQRIIESTDLTAGCGAAPAGQIAVDGRGDDWRAEPTMIAGTGRYASGEYVWTDYPFDDDGTGSFQYPGERQPLIATEGGPGVANERGQRYGANAADVVELRATADEAFLHLLVRLNFLNAVDSTVVGFAIDADGDPATGVGAWPRGARVTTPGTELFVTAFGACAYVTDATGEVALDAIGGAAAVATADNVIELALPRALFGDADRLRIAAGAGVWDPAAGRWMVPSVGTAGRNGNNSDRPAGATTPMDPAIFNLLFRTDETTKAAPADNGSVRTFQTERQNETLLGGTTGDYALDLQLSRLGNGAPADDPMPVRRGEESEFVRVYRSRIDAEGVVVGGSGGNFALFLSRYQPYTVNLPACYESGDCPWPAGRAPAILGLHGGSGTHLEAGDEPSIAEGGTNLYGQRSTHDALEAAIAPVTVRTLGRGQRPPWHRGYGEIDELEVLADATARYDLDPDRRMIMGGSLGGYGTLRLASLYPDLFSGAFAHCPAAFENGTGTRFDGHVDPSGQPFTVMPIMPNLLNVPVRQASGTFDPLVPITTDHRLRDAALAAELDFRYTEYLAGGHCWDNAEGGVYPWIANHVPEMVELLTSPRTTDPARVRYLVDPRQYFPGPETIGVTDIRHLGLDYDGAYWLSGLELREDVIAAAALDGAGEDVVGGVDAISRARPGWHIETESCGDGIGFGGELGGNPDLQPRVPTPHAYRCQAQRRTGEVANQLDLAARNTGAVTVDVAGAGLDGHEPLLVRATGDGPLALTLDGVTGGSVLGTCVTDVDRGPHVVTLHLELAADPCTIDVRGGAGVAGAGSEETPTTTAESADAGAGGCPWTEFTRLPGVSTFPDNNTQVFQCVYAAGPAHETVITGRPPAARFWSFALVDQARREIDNISDDEVVLDDDGSYRIVVRAACADEPNCIETAGGPAPFAPGLVYYRLYVPVGQYGGESLPSITYRATGVEGAPALALAELLADHEYALTEPITPGGEGFEALASASGAERPVAEPTAADPQPERFRGTGAAQVDALEGAGAPAPVVDAGRTALGEGGFGGTKDNAYLTMAYDMRQGNVVLRAKAPTYRGSGPAANDLGRADQSEQVRYWSLCTTQGTRSVDCVRDEQVAVDADGYFTVLLAPTCPADGYSACLRTGISSGVGRGTLLYRNTLARDDFYNDAGPAVCPESAVTMFCGEYELVARYVSRA